MSYAQQARNCYFLGPILVVISMLYCGKFVTDVTNSNGFFLSTSMKSVIERYSEAREEHHQTMSASAEAKV
jgi:hypothetical protein